MKKGQIYEGIVEKCDFPNRGVLTYREDDKETKVYVKGVIPGQKISFRLDKKRQGTCEGKLLNVLEDSDLEDREPQCGCYGECGGCFYQKITYDNQLALKGDMVKALLDKAISQEYVFEGILGSPFEWAYRNKMEYSFGDEYKDGLLALGLHKKNHFHDIITTSDCRIVASDYNDILYTTLKYFTEIGLPFYHKMAHSGYLRHLVIRRTVKTEEILVNIVTTGTFTELSQYGKYSEKDIMDEWKNRLLSLDLYGNIKGIVHTYNDSLADVVQCDRSDIIYGQDFVTEKLLGLNFKITPFSFFQTNTLGAEILYSKAREYVGDTKDKTVFDLYSGTGTIAQVIAPVAKKVIGVEIIEEAVESAKINADKNGLDNCRFIAGDVLKVIDDIKEKPDLIILDPPRDGVNPTALKKIIDYGVDRIVYISCQPKSLARDLEIFEQSGYEVERACCVDMFPQTVHVETIVALHRTGM